MFLFFIKIHKSRQKVSVAHFEGRPFQTFSRSGQSLKCFWFSKKFIKSRQEESGEHFEVRTPPEIFGKGQHLKCFSFFQKCMKVSKKASWDHFECKGDHFKGPLFWILSNFEMFLFFLSKTHTLSNKSVGKPFLWVGETIYMSKWFKYVKSWNVLIFHQIAYTSEYTCRESIFRVREPILRVKTFKKSHF